MTTTETAAPDRVSEEVLASTILARLLPELQALPSEELIQVNVDVPSAVATVLGSLPEIQALRGSIAQSMPSFDLVAFDKLEDYAIALNAAHGDYLVAHQPPNDLRQHVAEGTELRDLLLSDAGALARRGLIDENKLQELKGAAGFKNLASDLNVLYKALTESWPRIQGKCAVTEAELERAAKLGQRILRVVGLREQSTAVVASAADVRIRAFTLFAKTYDHARRAVTFLRWNEGDSDKIAPSFYAGRTARKRGPDIAQDGKHPPAPAHAGESSPVQLNPASKNVASAGGPSAPAPARGIAGDPNAEPFLS
jgi:hypothetical protein